MWDLDLMIGFKPKRKPKGRFAKGHVPHNKGKKWSEWMDGRKRRKVLKCLELGRIKGNPNIGGWNRKAVVGISIEGKVCIFESSRDAGKKLGIEERNIRSCCEGKRNLAGGIFFQWAENWNGKTELTDEQKRIYDISIKRKATRENHK